ncbi:uncharacterized protein LOC133778057 [Humulus lupulus]|uniref:uncharacterized protein LOC133778057 n=1 Tax=Humulus lupulus TaxID=3486 RepID=UPI002B4135B3|nr:uncharacterized protein LOC133778057 [Humulus lupulus]
MICSRLSEVLPHLISQNQGAFVRGRSVAHNILIFQDLIKNYNRKNSSPRCALKIDLSKAYDTVDWCFLERLLIGYHFPIRFVQWVMVCLRGTSYVLMMNGRLQGGFKGVKGLRQGDPISPLLFVLIMEYLTRLLQLGAHQQQEFRYHPLCKGLKIINLCFADNLVVFCKANCGSVQMLKQVFEEFCNSTGLRANSSKSHVFFGGVSVADRNQLLKLVQLEEGTFPLKYLGVPMRPTKWRMADCDEILKKISIVKEVDKLCMWFLWGNNGTRSKFHLTSWTSVCLSKGFGGLGFGEGSKWNKAMLAKYVWEISNKPDTLWDPINYHKFVWKRTSMPKHRFITWQAVNGRLLTHDHLNRVLGQLESTLCPVCEIDAENHEHLFFGCKFSQKVTRLVHRWLDCIWPLSFSDWSQWIGNMRRDVIAMIVAAAFSATVYYIWFNRNSCYVNHCSSSVECIVDRIKKDISYRCNFFSQRKLTGKELVFVRNISSV